MSDDLPKVPETDEEWAAEFAEFGAVLASTRLPVPGIDYAVTKEVGVGDEIKPALTPDEWEDGETVDGEVALSTTRGGDVHVSEGDDCVTIYPIDRHAVAAFCLHGQPFGFTREMLNGLRALYRMGCECGVISPDDFKEWDDAQDEVPKVIARIAALLPPEPAP